MSNIKEKEKQPDNYCEYGFISCFECDEIFTNKEELEKHEKEHLINEQVVAI